MTRRYEPRIELFLVLYAIRGVALALSAVTSLTRTATEGAY